MARDRQRAKRRQAERRAERLAARGETAGDGGAEARARAVDEVAGADDDLQRQAELAAGAPPSDLGRSDEVIEHEEPPPPDLRGEDAEEEEAYYEEREELGEAETDYAPRGVRGHERDEEQKRSRVVEFLKAVVAELRRVQWPDRRALTTLTGVVLGFVLIAGGYLGLLDAIFSRVVQAIL